MIPDPIWVVRSRTRPFLPDVPTELPQDRRRAFLALLDDASPAVREALTRQFRDLGQSGISFLRQVATGTDRRLADHAAYYLTELDVRDPTTEFVGFIRSLRYELETGCILLSRTVNRSLEASEVCGTLDDLGRRVRELAPEPIGPREKCRVLNRVLFHEHGLRAGQDPFHDPRNSFIDQVLRRKTGLPVTLSIIYLLVGDRAGLELEPVGLPGHFLVGCYAEDRPFFIDAFHQGILRTVEEVFQMLRDANVTPRLTDLAPTPVGEVLCRCCRNLVSHYAASGDQERSRMFAHFVDEFDAIHQQQPRH